MTSVIDTRAKFVTGVVVTDDKSIKIEGVESLCDLSPLSMTTATNL